MRKKAERKCGIYKITSPSGRVYIGQSNNINRRFNEYKLYEAKNQIKLKRSFVKYGIDNHKFEIIEECLLEELNIRERYWQDYYNCVEKGLNCVLVNTDSKQKVLSKKYKQAISNTLHQNARKENKMINQYSLDGKFLKSWKNPKEIRETLKISTTSILLCCRGKIVISANKFIWKFDKEPLKICDLVKIKNRKAISKKVYQYDYNYQLVNTWNSKNEAEKFTGFVLHNCLHNKQFLTKGFVWSYKELNLEELKYKFSKQQKLHKILQYDLDGNFIKEWYSEKELIREKNLQIVRYLKNNNSVIKQNYLWKLNN